MRQNPTPEPIVTEIPLPQPPLLPVPTVGGPQVHEMPVIVPSIGTFFAEARGPIDARKVHLQRLGMLPQHVTALAMPDIVDKPVPPPAVGMDDLPPTATTKYEMRPLPKLPGVNVSLSEE